jgi:hypothetical protein
MIEMVMVMVIVMVMVRGGRRSRLLLFCIVCCAFFRLVLVTSHLMMDGLGALFDQAFTNRNWAN